MIHNKTFRHPQTGRFIPAAQASALLAGFEFAARQAELQASVEVTQADKAYWLRAFLKNRKLANKLIRAGVKEALA